MLSVKFTFIKKKKVGGGRGGQGEREGWRGEIGLHTSAMTGDDEGHGGAEQQ